MFAPGWVCAGGSEASIDSSSALSSRASALSGFFWRRLVIDLSCPAVYRPSAAVLSSGATDMASIALGSIEVSAVTASLPFVGQQ